IHSWTDRELFLRGMPVHENEHAGKSVRRALEDGTRNHFAGIAAQARRGADPAHARAEQIACRRRALRAAPYVTLAAAGRASQSEASTVKTFRSSLVTFPFSLLPRCNDPLCGSCS